MARTYTNVWWNRHLSRRGTCEERGVEFHSTLGLICNVDAVRETQAARDAERADQVMCSAGELNTMRTVAEEAERMFQMKQAQCPSPPALGEYRRNAEFLRARLERQNAINNRIRGQQAPPIPQQMAVGQPPVEVPTGAVPGGGPQNA